jgi:acyl-coenzyme A thioesterase PaaI-like protein
MMRDQSGNGPPPSGGRTIETLGFTPDPQDQEWHYRPASLEGRFHDIYGDLRFRLEPDGRARIRVYPDRRHSNYNENMHGGFALALIDHALFIGPAALGIAGALGGSTIETSTHFFAPLRPYTPADTVLEVMRVTGRMIFSRGVIEQEGVACVSFLGVTKKGPQRVDAPATVVEAANPGR